MRNNDYGNYIGNDVYSRELNHFGVLGMKWGIRKANNMYRSASTPSQKS